MKTYTADEALQILEEFSCIDMYESLVTIIIENDLESLADYEYDIPDDRMDPLETLIQAKYLDFQQLYRIFKVDNFILNNEVPTKLKPFKAWLKSKGLIDKYPDSIPEYPTPEPLPMLEPSPPKCGAYSKKDIEFFKRRTEVYLNLWENASIEDVAIYNTADPRSLASVRSALHRVFWGNHLSEAELMRLAHADLRLYQDPQADKIAPKFIDIIMEFFDEHEIKERFAKANELNLRNYKPNVERIKSFLNSWDWFTHDWDSLHDPNGEIEESIKSRVYLDEFYKKDELGTQAIKELIALDNAALLSPNWMYIAGEHRLRISKFLMEQGEFDPLDYETKVAQYDQGLYLKAHEKNDG